MKRADMTWARSAIGWRRVKADGTFMSRREKIEELRALGANWNSYDCEAFSHKSIDAALMLEPNIPIEFDSIMPIAGGGVMFGKNGDEITIEVYAAD